MDKYVAANFALMLSKQAELLAMQAENSQREILGQSLAYNAEHFREVASELENLAHDTRLL